jgi:hypothetical protein
MKFIATLLVAVLLCIVAVMWFAEPNDVTDATQAVAIASGVEPRQSIEGNGEMAQRPKPQHRVVPPVDSTARRDDGSNSATSAPTGGVALAAREPGQVAVRDATETVLGQATDIPSVEPPAIDKTACEAAARTLNESLSLYDVTPTQAIAYGKPRPFDLYQVNAFTQLKERLLAPLCSGTDAFDRAYPIESEFVAIGPQAHVRILVGDHWISDGTVLSFLSEADQNFFASSILQRRRDGPGPNLSRDGFERQLARNPQALIGGQ